MHKRFTKAFTLIELLVVIAIIGILTGFIFVSMNGAVNSAKDTKRKADLSTISKAIMAYMAQNNNAYPYTATTTACNLCNNDSCTNPCAGFYANIQSYLSNIPLDPDGSTYYTYTYSATPKFVLKTTLSNTYVYQYDSTSGFSTLSYSSTCTAATNAKVSCTVITISSTEEACKCLYLSGDGQTTWTVPSEVSQVDYLVVAGGGGGGGTTGDAVGGGGGGGGMRTGTGFGVSGSITIIVGAGGSPRSSGSNSSFSTITSAGGGGGSCWQVAGLAGGSGGGGGAGTSIGVGGTGTAGQGNNGGNGSGAQWWGAGGGGGAGAVGAVGNASYGGNGGIGLTSSISGTSVYYGGGGGGGIQASGTAAGSGGNGGGGNGGKGVAASNGTNGQGGGGGGGVDGTSGGSGIVIIKYIHP